MPRKGHRLRINITCTKPSMQRSSTHTKIQYSYCLCTITFIFQLNSLEVFTLANLLDKPWSQASSLLPPGACLYFYRASMGCSIPTARRFSSKCCATQLTLSPFPLFICLKQDGVLLRVCTHSVRLEPTKLILAGRRTTYQATMTPQCCEHEYEHRSTRYVYTS